MAAWAGRVATARRPGAGQLGLVGAVGVLVGLLPPGLGAPLALGAVLFVVALARPALPVYWLGLAAPIASAREVRVGPVGVSGTEALVTIALVAGGLALLTRRGEAGAREPARWAAPVAAFLLFALLSASWAASLPDAAKELLKWGELAAAFVLVATTIRTVRQVKLLLAMLFVGALAEAALGAYQFFFRVGPPSFEIGRFFRAHGTFGQPNPFGGYMGMVLPLGVAVALWDRSTRWRVLALATAGACALAMGMSQSRGAWLGAAGGIAALMMAAGRRTMAAVLLGGLVASLVALLGAFEALPAALTTRLAPLTQYFGVFDVRTIVLTPQNWAVVERMAHWQAAFAMWEARPLLGVGIGQYAFRYPDFYLAGWADPLGHAHNYYLNVAAETGAVGLALYLAMVASWALMALRLARGRVGLARAIGLGALGVVCATATHNLFDNLYVSGMNVHQGVVLGLVAACLYHAPAHDAARDATG